MSTTVAPPAWLEAAANLDSLVEDKVPLSASGNEPPEVVDDDADREGEAPAEPIKVTARQEPRPPVKHVEAKPHLRIMPPVVVTPDAAPAAEADLAWHGYSAAALLPSTFAMAVVTGSVIVLLRPLVPTWVLHEAADAPLAALWLLQAIRAGYRLFGYNYRLTTRRLFRDRGRLYPPDAPLDLATVVRAEVRQSLIGRLAGVGTVRVIPEKEEAAVDLVGVRRPKVLAARIEEAAKAARDANVTVGRAGGVPNAAGSLSDRSS